MTWFRKKRQPPAAFLVGTPNITINRAPIQILSTEKSSTQEPLTQQAPTITATKQGNGGGILIKVEITITGKG